MYFKLENALFVCKRMEEGAGRILRIGYSEIFLFPVGKGVGGGWGGVLSTA